MKELIVISGKGGTGKTSLAAAFASQYRVKVISVGKKGRVYGFEDGEITQKYDSRSLLDRWGVNYATRPGLQRLISSEDYMM